jgi:hypothetical protein
MVPGAGIFPVTTMSGFKTASWSDESPSEIEQNAALVDIGIAPARHPASFGRDLTGTCGGSRPFDRVPLDLGADAALQSESQ